MPAKMWFGTENRFQWVPTPSSGISVQNVGFTEEMDYQTGRKGVVTSMQYHKEYEINIPIQEAAGLEGTDVYNKFASGLYGDMDDYPIFFADPMNYDQNLFPPHFAAPGLYRRGWGALVDDTPRQYINWATNPSVEVDAVGWSGIPGTGGALINTGQVGPEVTLAWSGQYRWQQTWGTGTSAVSGGVQFTGSPVSVSGGVTQVGSYMYVNSVSKIQRFNAIMRFRNASGTQLSAVTGPQTVAQVNTWTKVEVPLSTAPVGTTRVDIEVVAVSGTSGTSWGTNNILRADGAMIYTDVEPPFWFDWNTPGAALAGVQPQARSVLYVGRLTPTFTNTAANSYNLPPQGVIWNVTSQANAQPGPSSHVPYAIIPIPPGYRLHLGWTGAVTGTAEVVVEGWNAPLSKQSTTVMTPLSSSGAQRMNTTVDSVDYAKVYVRRTTNVASTVNISSMMAQLWPIGVTPNLNGNFIEGKGHRGLKFGDRALVESYVLVDPNSPGGIRHLKGMSTRLIEAQDRG